MLSGWPVWFGGVVCLDGQSGSGSGSGRKRRGAAAYANAKQLRVTARKQHVRATDFTCPRQRSCWFEARNEERPACLRRLAGFWLPNQAQSARAVLQSLRCQSIRSDDTHYRSLRCEAARATTISLQNSAHDASLEGWLCSHPQRTVAVPAQLGHMNILDGISMVDSFIPISTSDDFRLESSRGMCELIRVKAAHTVMVSLIFDTPLQLLAFFLEALRSIAKSIFARKVNKIALPDDVLSHRAFPVYCLCGIQNLPHQHPKAVRESVHHAARRGSILPTDGKSL